MSPFKIDAGTNISPSLNLKVNPDGSLSSFILTSADERNAYSFDASLTTGQNYYVHSDNIKVMANYIHTWSDFRSANPKFGDDQFDEVILRLQVLF